MGKRKGNSERHSRNMNLDHEVELRGRLSSPDMKVDHKDVSESNEVRFGRHLAHSSDKYTRDRTVGALKVWLSRRNKAGKLTDLDLLQIWKGLWYSMWLCDKAAVQLELAESLGRLIFVYAGQLEEGLRFFRFFCKTMQVQWGQVDHLRIDKYYTLIRIVLRGSLRFCLDEEVQEGAKSFSGITENGTAVRGGLLAFMDILQDEILEKLPNGLRLHVSDVFLDELWRASYQPSSSSSTLSTLEFLLALEPFFSVLQAGGVKGQGATSSAFFKRVLDRILRRLPMDILYESDDEKRDIGRRTAAASEEEWRMLFPRVSLPAVQGRIFALASDKATSDKHREDMYDILQNIQAISMERGSGSQKSVHEVVRKMWLERKGPVSSAKHGVAVYGWAATANNNGELEGGGVDGLNNEAAEVTGGGGGGGEVQKVLVPTSSNICKSKRKRKNSRQGQQHSEEFGGIQKSGAEEEVRLEADNTTQETAVRKRKKRNLSTNDESPPSSSGLTKASSRTKITHSSMTPSGKQTTKQQEERNALGRERPRRRVTFGETHFKPYSESTRHLRRLTPEKANAVDITPSKSSLKKVRCKSGASESSNDEIEKIVVKESLTTPTVKTRVKQSLTTTPTVKTRKKENQRPQVCIEP